tara:strand:+ start:138 stop:713 length:576 start_codon:yes stop_codon:yes gene_type:complete
MANEQNHELKTCGPQFLIDTGNGTMTHAGKTVFFIQGISKDKIKHNVSFHETGFARVYTERTLQVESGVLGSSNEKNNIAFRQIVHNGHYAVNADKGEIRLAAKNIILDAENEIILKTPGKIQIGDPNGTTGDIQLEAKTVDVITRGGNIGDLLKTSSLFSSFSGSFVSSSSLVSAASKMYNRRKRGSAFR